MGDVLLSLQKKSRLGSDYMQVGYLRTHTSFIETSGLLPSTIAWTVTTVRMNFHRFEMYAHDISHKVRFAHRMITQVNRYHSHNTDI